MARALPGFMAMLASVIFGVAASAAEYRSREVGGWEVGETSSGDSCYIGMEYEGEGETLVLLSLDVEGTPYLLVSNYNWSIKDKDEFSLDYRLSNGTYTEHPAFGTKNGTRGGFVTTFETRFPEYFAQSTYLHITRDGNVVDNLSLTGTAVAVAELRRCVAIAKARTDAEAREKARLSHIPKDPFAATEARDAGQ